MLISDELGIDVELDLEGELRYLSNTIDEESAAISKDTKLAPSLNDTQFYGSPLSPEEASEAVPVGSDGLIRYAIVVPDDFCVDGKLPDGLNKRDFDVQNGVIKPRRPTLPIRKKDLMSSLTKVDGEDGPRYIFNGVLNGWPSLRHFELIGLEKKRSLPGRVPAPHYILDTIGKAWTPHWSAEKEGTQGIPPEIPDTGKVYRATLRGAPWTSLGWSPTSPGFVFWYEAHNNQGPRVLYGANIISEVKDDVCKMVHMISHRYAVKNRESPREKLTYHSLVFLEWENSPYGTILEGAFLNGIGGYKGKCNWYHDKDDDVTALYENLPPELISPWLTTATELRCYDVEAKNLDEIKEYIEKYIGERFIDPQYTFSYPARLTYRSRSNIAQYLVNYVSRNCSYSEMARNCQTFAADLCSFLAGKKDVVPYHPINRIDYYNRSHLFLYDSSMYKAKKSESLKGKVAK
eukprot:jgi/Psemu1/318663/estExt_fgenesh1_pm.C_1040002